VTSGVDILRRWLSAVSLALAGAALIWALALVLVGGFEFELLGHTVTSNEPLRLLAIAAFLLVVFVLSYGVERSYQLWLATAARVPERLLVLAIAVAVTAAGIAYNTTAASGPDQYGYVSQADLWVDGRLHVAQPWAGQVPWPNSRWTFSPLGYRPVEEGDRWEIVPTYSPGLPLLMAGAKLVGGQEAMFLVVPLLGGAMVLATWGIGCRLGSSTAGLIAAWLVATSPAFLLHLVVPMSDVATASAWTMAVLLVFARNLPAAIGAGLLAGAGLMIRPNLAPLALVIAVYVLFRRGRWPGRRSMAEAVAFCVPVVAAGIAVAAIYQHLYGSPFVSGYGRLSDQFSWVHVRPNIRNYLSWLVETQTAFGLVGLAAALVPLGVVWRGVDRSTRLMMAVMVAAVWAQYFAYLVFENSSYLRFLLVTWPFLMLGLGFAAAGLVSRGRPGLTLAVAGLVVALGIVAWRDAARAGAFDAWRTDRRFVAAALLTRDLTPPNSAVLAMIHSGSLRYYGGRMTIRYDIMDGGWLDGAVGWLRDRGVPTYALLEEWELEPFATRFAGERLVARLDRPPLAVYRGAGTIGLYDLSAPAQAPEDHPPTVLAAESFRGLLRSVPPAPPPALVLAR
jgi:hypothetical protein